MTEDHSESVRGDKASIDGWTGSFVRVSGIADRAVDIRRLALRQMVQDTETESVMIALASIGGLEC
jgi:hypothetical protein